MLLSLSLVMMSSSLFFSAQERAAIERLENTHIANPREKEELPLVLNGILYRPDLNHWIVWINGTRIYSQRPQSIHGWTIISVSMDSVVVRSSSGEERELRPEQDPDLDEFDNTLEDTEGYPHQQSYASQHFEQDSIENKKDLDPRSYADQQGSTNSYDEHNVVKNTKDSNDNKRDKNADFKTAGTETGAETLEDNTALINEGDLSDQDLAQDNDALEEESVKAMQDNEGSDEEEEGEGAVIRSSSSKACKSYTQTKAKENIQAFEEEEDKLLLDDAAESEESEDKFMGGKNGRKN